MSEEQQKSSDASAGKLGNAIRALWRGLVRTLLSVLLGLVIGVGGYFGYMYFSRDLASVLSHDTRQISSLESNIDQAQAQIEDRLSQYNERLAALERQRDADAESISELAADTEAIEEILQDHEITFGRLDTLETAVQELVDELNQAATSTPQAETVDFEEKLAELAREVQLLRAMELLSRSRLYMVQNNFGLAGRDIQKAHQVLVELQPQVPEHQAEVMLRLVHRLDLALENLPDYPIRAAEDLEIAWAMLATGLSAEPTDLDLYQVLPDDFTKTPIEPTFTDSPDITRTPWNQSLTVTPTAPTETPADTPETTPAKAVTQTPQPTHTPWEVTSNQQVALVR